MQIGIPRALVFYTYFPFWLGFFQGLGIEVILSDTTTKTTVSKGASLVVSETCLPIKVYMGHVLNLIEKGVKNIFVPSIQSIAPKIYNCSKIRGLPDLVRNVVKQDINIIEATYDKSEKNRALYDFLKEIAEQFNITDKKVIQSAARNGQKTSRNFKLMMQSNISWTKAIDYLMKGQLKIVDKQEETGKLKVAVIAHGYNLYDDAVSMRILDKLTALGAISKTAEHLTEEQMQQGIESIGSIVYWANEMEITGAASYYITKEGIDGIILINAFGCGPDSLMVERISRFAKLNEKPFLNLSIDEQTGEAGFITRIEAFLDMLQRKKRIKEGQNLLNI